MALNKFKNFHVVDHPLVRHKLTLIRDKKTGHQLFRELVNEVSSLIAFEVTRDLPLRMVNIETPLTKTKGAKIKGENIVLVPVLRAGLGMMEGIVRLIPNARIGYVGIERDETTHRPVHYYFKIPRKPEKSLFIIIDPMLATGGTAVATADRLIKLGAKKIKFLCLIAAPEGVAAFCEAHPDIHVYAAALDKRLNQKKYIVPGLGDAGDRLFGTK